MRLKTKLVLAATGVTFTIVLVLSSLFLSQLLRQRISQTASMNDVMVRQVLLMTRSAVATGLVQQPPVDASDRALHEAVTTALRNSGSLTMTMDGFVRYSPAVQDVSVTDAQGLTLVSSDPQMLDRPITRRARFTSLSDAKVLGQAREMFGTPEVLDVSVPLDRNGRPFLVVHVGVRSSFLRNNYVPWLRNAFWLILLCALISVFAAAVLASIALRPIEEISRRLGTLAEPAGTTGRDAQLLEDGHPDAVARVSNTIDRLGRQMQQTAAGYIDLQAGYSTLQAGYSTLQANTDRMLDTLRDGVVLFTSDQRAVMVSDAVAQFIDSEPRDWIGLHVNQIFLPETQLGSAIAEAFAQQRSTAGELLRLEDGRDVEFALDRTETDGRTATLLTLRDRGSARRLEQELEVSRRLAAVGRLTAGVGHEVKNPINAMVVHLELLRAKLQDAGQEQAFLQGAMRHVDILSDEMHRLDHVVETLADFTRPMDLRLQDLDLGDLTLKVMALTDAEATENGITMVNELHNVAVRGDGEMLRQALLNLVLNAMQAVEEAGAGSERSLELSVFQEADAAVFRITDDGAGISPEILPKIFDLYFTTKVKGSGIGLAMTYRIVQMHGGSMQVESEPGRGAVFTMRLPALAPLPIHPVSQMASRNGTPVRAGRLS